MRLLNEKWQADEARESHGEVALHQGILKRELSHWASNEAVDQERGFPVARRRAVDTDACPDEQSRRVRPRVRKGSKARKGLEARLVEVNLGVGALRPLESCAEAQLERSAHTEMLYGPGLEPQREPRHAVEARIDARRRGLQPRAAADETCADEKRGP